MTTEHSVPIIALHGSMGSGKSTVASWIVEELWNRNIEVRQLAFADAIKYFLSTYFKEMPNANLYGPSSRRGEVVKAFAHEEVWYEIQHNRWRSDRGLDFYFARLIEDERLYRSFKQGLLAWLLQVRDEAIHAGGITARRLLTTLGDVGRALSPSFWIDLTFAETRKDSITVLSDTRYLLEAQKVRDAGGELWYLTRNAHADQSHSSEQGTDAIIQAELVNRVIDNANQSPEETKETVLCHVRQLLRLMQ